MEAGRGGEAQASWVRESRAHVMVRSEVSLYTNNCILYFTAEFLEFRFEGVRRHGEA